MDMNKPDAESMFLLSNEKLLSSKAYIICAVDKESGDLTFVADVTKLNKLEVHGFLKLTQEHVSDLWGSIEQSEMPPEEEGES